LFMFRKARDNSGGDQQKGKGIKEALKVEKRDQSKQIKKEGGPKGPKKISLEQLRRDDGDRKPQGKGGK
jgi:hypothetical protein